MANPATHPADPAPSRPDARRGVLSGLLAFGVRLVGALKEKAQALAGARQDAPDLSGPLARVNQLIWRILSLSARLREQANAAERPGAETSAAVEPAARPKGERLGEYEDIFEDLREFEYELEDEFEEFEDFFADLREERENRFEKPRDPWADLPFDEAVALFWEELQDIASALGEHPLAREIQAAAAMALCPPLDQSPPLAEAEPDFAEAQPPRLAEAPPRFDGPSPPNRHARRAMRRRIGSAG